jgi:hypothetical protein
MSALGLQEVLLGLELICDQIVVEYNQMEIARLLVRYGNTSLNLGSLVGSHRFRQTREWLILSFAAAGNRTSTLKGLHERRHPRPT